MEVSREESRGPAAGQQMDRVQVFPDDFVGKPLLDRSIVSGGMDAQAREATQQKDYQQLVARQLSFRRDPEAYWKQLCAERDETSGMGTPGTRLDGARGLRHEMQALIPHVAHARVQRDALRILDPNIYLQQLSRALRNAEQTADASVRGEGTPVEQRLAVDQVRLIRAQLAEVQKLIQQGPEAWRALRVQEVRNQNARLPPAVLPEKAMEPRGWQDKLAALRSERDQLRFWQLIRRVELNGQIAELEKREAYDLRKQTEAAEQKKTKELAAYEQWKGERAVAQKTGFALRKELSHTEEVRRHETAKMPDLQPIQETIERARRLFDSTDLAERIQASTIRARATESLLTELDRVSIALRHKKPLSPEEADAFLRADRRLLEVPIRLREMAEYSEKPGSVQYAERLVWSKRAQEVIRMVRMLDTLSALDRWTRARIDFRKKLEQSSLSNEELVRGKAQLDELWRQGLNQRGEEPLQRYVQLRRAAGQAGIDPSEKQQLQWQAEETWREAVVASAGKIRPPEEFQMLRENFVRPFEKPYASVA